MREKDIEEAVCAYARKKYKAIAYKFTSPQRRNVPDRVFCFFDGLILFVEFKAPGKKVTGGQKREIDRLIGRGHNVYVCDDIESGKRWIDGWLKGGMG